MSEPEDWLKVLVLTRETRTSRGLTVERWVPLGTDPETWDYTIRTTADE